MINSCGFSVVLITSVHQCMKIFNFSQQSPHIHKITHSFPVMQLHRICVSLLRLQISPCQHFRGDRGSRQLLNINKPTAGLIYKKKTTAVKYTVPWVWTEVGEEILAAELREAIWWTVTINHRQSRLRWAQLEEHDCLLPKQVTSVRVGKM